MKPQIYLIRAYGQGDAFRCIPWGIVDIASYLKKYGYKVAIADRNEKPYSLRKIAQEISNKNIDYIGISAMTSQAQDASFLCRYFKKQNRKVILGGLHYTVCPQEGLEIGDYIFKGEAEKAILNFLENGPKHKVYESEPLLDLDEIPLPDEELINRIYLNKANLTILTARGCYYNCSFCLDKKYRPPNVRRHSAKYIGDLIEMFNKSFGIKNFFIGDDIFTINKKHALETCREIKKRALKIKLSAFTHSGIDDLELYKEMYDAGFEALSLGVESGSDKVLNAINKQQTVAQAKRTIGIIKESGLRINVMFMVGNILETEDSLKTTYDLAKELGLAGWVSYAQPFPGTKFAEIIPQYGTLINKDPRTYWNNRIAFVPYGLSKRILKYYHDRIAAAIKAPVSLAAQCRFIIVPLGIKNYLKQIKILAIIYRAIYKRTYLLRYIPLKDYLDIRKLNLILKLRPYTMVSYRALSHIYDLAKLVEENKAEGCFVECGIWKGGCAAIMAKIMHRFGNKRKIWLFDSFQGLPEPTAKDGHLAREAVGDWQIQGRLNSVNICVASRQEAIDLLISLKLYGDNIIIKEGWFQDTLPKYKNEIGPVAILRLDGDWYESTKCCLENLYDNVVAGGYIIIDDYGYWEGCKKATDEFLAGKKISNTRLVRVDSGCYYFQKP